MKKGIIKVIIVFIFLLSNSSVTIAEYAPDEQINISVYEKISPAIVAIEAQVKDVISAGTGCIV